MFNLNQSNMIKAGLRSTASKAASSRAVLLAGSVNDMMKKPQKYIKIMPLYLENGFQKLIKEQEALQTMNHRKKLMIKLGIINLERTRKNLYNKIKTKPNNVSTVLRRLQTNPEVQRRLLVAERLAKSTKPNNQKLLRNMRSVDEMKSLHNLNHNLFKQTYPQISVTRKNIQKIANAGLIANSRNYNFIFK